MSRPGLYVMVFMIWFSQCTHPTTSQVKQIVETACTSQAE